LERLTVKQIASITGQSEETIRRKIRRGKEDPESEENLTASLNSSKQGYRVPVEELVRKNILSKEEVAMFLKKRNNEKADGILGESPQSFTDNALLLRDEMLAFDRLMQLKFELINELERYKREAIAIETRLVTLEGELAASRERINLQNQPWQTES